MFAPDSCQMRRFSDMNPTSVSSAATRSREHLRNQPFKIGDALLERIFLRFPSVFSAFQRRSQP